MHVHGGWGGSEDCSQSYKRVCPTVSGSNRAFANNNNINSSATVLLHSNVSSGDDPSVIAIFFANASHPAGEILSVKRNRKRGLSSISFVISLELLSVSLLCCSSRCYIRCCFHPFTILFCTIIQTKHLFHFPLLIYLFSTKVPFGF